MNEIDEAFAKQTAKDYCISIEVVKNEFKKAKGDIVGMYERLEIILKDKSND